MDKIVQIQHNLKKKRRKKIPENNIPEHLKSVSQKLSVNHKLKYFFLRNFIESISIKPLDGDGNKNPSKRASSKESNSNAVKKKVIVLLTELLIII